MVLGYMFRPHCGHFQANLYRLSALIVRTIWDPIVCKIMTCVVCHDCTHYVKVGLKMAAMRPKHVAKNH